MSLSEIDRWLDRFDTTLLKRFVLLLSVILVLIFGLVYPLGVPPDYLAYLEVFGWTYSATWLQVIDNPKSWEPAFMLLVFGFAKLDFSSTAIFLFFVLIATSFKALLFYKLSTPIAYALVMLVFFFKIFPLQDYNQLRGALAVGFLMLFYSEWTFRTNVLSALVYAVVAIAFHYLALAVLPLLILACLYVPQQRVVVAVSGVLLAMLIVLGFPVLLDVVAYLVPRVEGYLVRVSEPAASSYISPVLYPEVFLVVVSLYFWRQCTDNMKRIIFLQFLGFGVFYGLFDFGVVSSRLREVVSAFWLFYIADYAKMSTHLRASTIIFVGMNIVLGVYLFYISDFFEVLSIFPLVEQK